MACCPLTYSERSEKNIKEEHFSGNLDKTMWKDNA